MNRLPGLVVTLWLGLLALDGLLGLLSVALSAVGIERLVDGWAGIVTLLALGGLPWAWLAWAVSARVPARAVLLPSVLVAWTATGAVPLVFWLPWTATRLVVALATLAVVAVAVLPELRARRLFLDTGEGSGPSFRWGHAAGVLAGGAFAFVPGVLAWSVLCVDLGLRVGTGGFVALGLDGLAFASRTYERDGDRVHLVAMVHLGDADAYEALEAAVPEGAVTLLEGVTDARGHLPNGLDYGGVASKLGLALQPRELGGTRGRVVHADIDVADFSDTTRQLLSVVSELYAAGSTQEMIGAWLRYHDLVRADPERTLRVFWDDLVELRNAKVLATLDRVLGEDDVAVVPWGALHMKGLAEGLAARGFDEVEVTWRTMVRWPLR